MCSPTLTQPKNYLMWFRRDLRIYDNTALTMLFDSIGQVCNDESEKSDLQILALYSITPEQWLKHDMSLVQLDLIFRSLKQLASTLFNKLGITLQLIHSDNFDDSVDDISQFCTAHNITHIFANIEYEINEPNRDSALATKLAQQDIECHYFHDQCILPPNTVKTNEDTLYKVFTPFFKKWQSIIDATPIQVYPAPTPLDSLTDKNNKNELEQLLQQIDDHQQQTLKQFQTHYLLPQSTMNALLKHTHDDYPAGENEAQHRLNNFIKDDISDYHTARDKPALMATSQLSAYLSVGSISARLCYQKAKDRLNSERKGRIDDTPETDIQRWISELAWRDFYRHVIVDRPDIAKGAAYKKEMDTQLSWSCDQQDFQAWCEGNTGVPLVDAAMRCLNQTGFMHNRLRMVTAMFLTKDLFIDWRWGERYFMQRLIDGDFASNNGGWQWSASVGTDAAPYFRIMNPFSQAKTHDKAATFIKTWLPELTDIPANILDDEVKLRRALSNKGGFADVDYPKPMVEHKQARRYAIAQFKAT